MSKKSKGSKNDMTNRGKKASLRVHNGHEVEPVQYDGSAFNLGKYMAARYKDKAHGNGLIIGVNGMPIPYARFLEQKN